MLLCLCQVKPENGKGELVLVLDVLFDVDFELGQFDFVRIDLLKMRHTVLSSGEATLDEYATGCGRL